MKQSKTYPNIDMIQTGLKLKMYIDNSEFFFTIENYLNLLHRCNCSWLSPWAFLINTLRQEEGK